jgi:hypothetical protein
MERGPKNNNRQIYEDEKMEEHLNIKKELREMRG